jgi:chitinase
LDGSPDPDYCAWRTGQAFKFFGCAFELENPCLSDEVLIVKDNYYTDSSGHDESCLGLGEASYCCKQEETGDKLCDWAAGTCVKLDNGKPPDGINVCDQGQQFVTYRKGPCGADKVQPFCCSAGVDIGQLACHWDVGSSPNCAAGTCGQNEVNLGAQEGGGGKSSCVIPPAKRQHGCPECIGTTYVYPTLCCNKDALRIDVKTLPVPLENLFFADDLKSLPADSKPDFAILTDTDEGNSDPNSNSFAWHIIDGPEEEVTTVDKRDGSHWEVYDCDPVLHEGQQTAKMVCTDDSADSNCDRIWLGEIVATVIKMPKG